MMPIFCRARLRLRALVLPLVAALAVAPALA